MSYEGIPWGNGLMRDMLHSTCLTVTIKRLKGYELHWCYRYEVLATLCTL